MTCQKRIVTRCFCFGVLLCGVTMGHAVALTGPDLRSTSKRAQASQGVGHGRLKTNGNGAYEESSTAAIRQRSAASIVYDPFGDQTWIPTGYTWFSTGHASPMFDESTPKNVSAQLGGTAYLHCIVKNLGDKTVSWIRRKDYNVLTAGLDTYTSDTRFYAIHRQNTGDWVLQIRFVQLDDEGTYECQVGSDPKISFFVKLTVLVAKASIEGAPEIYVKSGSAINLTCVITQSPSPPVFVFWYHDDRMINYDDARGLIAALQKGSTPDTAISKLSIVNVKPSDAGNYTCGPSNSEPTSISVHVISGEKQAAVQGDANSVISRSCGLHFRNHAIMILSTILFLRLGYTVR